MRRLKDIIQVFLFLFLTSSIHAQSESELKEIATKLFENEEYVDATSHYLRLISLNPKSTEYNFKYGTCLLFNSFQKKEAIRYLNYAVADQNIDPRAYYFHGRALHLNYQFQDAIKSYQKYIDLRGKKDKRYSAEREIAMCQNGKKLLVTFTDIVVSEKLEIEKEKFFRLYKNMETIGGDILVTADFQSKLDRKKGHIPIVHFPPQAKAIYYSSYGDNEDTGLDIYIRRRLPNGSWGDPQILPGQVNTNEDEDFPYMHPSGDFLYFSSKGHNSMGGFDVFYSVFNPDINAFGRPQNVDFAISSPDDDFFYVVDSTFKSAYFASSRQSQNGKVHVYNVRVARVPIQEVIVMGDFLSEINPNNEVMHVKVTSNSNGEEVGKIISNQSGKYSFVFPKGGKYNYEITIDGKEDIYKFLVELPFLDEFRPLKQKAVHKMVNGQEIVTIVNLFDEKVEGAEALMAEVIRKKSELDVNVNDFDLQELDKKEKQNKILAELGFTNMSINEVSGKLSDLAEKQVANEILIEQIVSNLDVAIISKSSELNELQEQYNILSVQADESNDVVDQYKTLLNAQKVESKLKDITSEIEAIQKIKTKVQTNSGSEEKTSVNKTQVLENQFNALVSAGKENEALDLLLKNKSVIKNIQNQSPDKFLQTLVNESLELTEELNAKKKQQVEFELIESNIESRNKQLENNLIDAKKKEAARIKSEINKNNEELKMIEEFLVDSKVDIQNLNKKLNALNSTIETLQIAMENDDLVAYSKSELEGVLQTVEEVENKTTSMNVSEQIAVIETSNPEVYLDDAEKDLSTALLNEKLNHIKNDLDEKRISVNEDENLSEVEKKSQLIELNKKAIERLEKHIATIEEELNNQPDNEALIQNNESFSALKEELLSSNQSIANEFDQEKQAENSPAITAESILKKISPNYEREVTDITSDEQKTEEEQLLALQELDEMLISELNKQLQSSQKIANKNPDNIVEVERISIIESLLTQKESEIAERTQLINAKSQNSSITSVSEVKAQFADELLTETTAQLKELDEMEYAGVKSELQRLSILEAQLEILKERQTEIEKSLSKSPDEEKLLLEKSAIEELILSHSQRFEANKQEAVTRITENNSNELISLVDKKYVSDIDELNEMGNSLGIVKREEALQNAIESGVNDRDKQLSKKYSIQADIEKAVFERLIEKSKEREDLVSKQVHSIHSTSKEDFINNLRSENKNSSVLNASPTTLEEINEQEQLLDHYEAEVRTNLSNVKEAIKTSSTPELIEQEIWLEEELKTIQDKKRSFSVLAGELETNVAASNNSKDPLKEIAKEEQSILERMNDPSVTKKEKKELQKNLESLDVKKVEYENSQLEESIRNASIDRENQTREIEELQANNVTNLLESVNSSEQELIDVLISQADNTKNELEKKRILEDIATIQGSSSNTTDQIINTQKQFQLEKKEEVEIVSQDELKKQRRKFTVQIGELTTQIEKTDEDINSAKKKDLPFLETKKQQLINQRSLLETQLRSIEERITQVDPLISIAPKEALIEAISFNDERKTAASEEYKAYYDLATKALNTEQEIKTLEGKLEAEQKKVRSLLEMELEDKGKLNTSIEKIRSTKEQIDRLKIDHIQQKYAANQVLEKNTIESMKMQNLVVRGVKPFQAQTVAASLIAMPSSGFEIKTEDKVESVYSDKNPIPIDVESPSGLYYRVQIGAFSKPIPQDLFKEFTPVSGEKIQGTNITRYMAGFFNSSTVVVDARAKIRSLGYSDAFIVAYCDGKRIGFGEARRLEAAGLCVPKGENELLMEVVAKTAEKLGIPTTNEVQEVSELSYNQSPGAAKASPIELKKGLFFTTQVGVYNRPIAAESVFGMPELITLRLPNGQIRYSSGTFNSIDEARPRRKEARSKGIEGAFITAYYKGERISLTEAKRLLSENGSAILQSNLDTVERVESVEEPSAVIRKDSVHTVNLTALDMKRAPLKVQYVSKKTFTEFPSELLNRLNTEGNFYYDSRDRLIKSINYQSVDDLPSTRNFDNLLDTVYLERDEVALSEEQVVVVKIDDTIVPGAFMDWLIKQPYQREFRLMDERIEVRISNIDPLRIEKVQEDIRTFVLDTEVKTVSEVEFIK